MVHCSAGIGRTGAIVAIEYILEKLQQGIPCESMDKILKELRNQRPFTIQNDMVPIAKSVIKIIEKNNFVLKFLWK